MQINEKITFIVLLILAIFTRFFFLNYPQEAVFDEVHFFNFVKDYSSRIYFFDIHPPLGKLTIFFVGWLTHFNFGNNLISNIGDLYQDSVFWLRFIPALFGALLVPLAFLFVKKITHSFRAAFFSGIFVLFNNALITQSHFILIDSQLIFFNIFTLYCFLSWMECQKKNQKLIWLILTGLSAGAAISVKLTGLSSLGVVFLFLLIDWFKAKKFYFSSIISLFKKFSLITLLAGAVYIFSFYCHFEILNQPGPGNVFMAEKYKVGLKKEAVPFWDKFIYLQKTIYRNTDVTARHPDESKWYQWIFNQKSIFYWINEDSKIYLTNNPFVLIGSTLAISLSLLYLIIKRERPFPGADFLLITYFSNLLPFIPIQRCLFLYHYLTAQIIAIFVLAILLDKYLPKNKKEFITLIIILITIFTFLYLSPITYGI